VLVVEDDTKLRKTARRILSDLGYQVLEATDGPTALELLNGDSKIDLLFTDVVMPNAMTGYQLAAAARALRPNIKVLLTTGYSEAFARDGDAVAAIALIGKPYRKQELAEKLRRIMEKP
jgi:CheY-like chemotaxis protein